MPGTFHDQLVTTRNKKHSKDHPFFELWAQGKLTKEQTAFYCAQHFHYVVEYLNWMAYEASQIPQRDVKAYVVACGLNPESVEDSAVLSGTDQLQNWGWRLVYQTPWPAALAGMFIGLES